MAKKLINPRMVRERGDTPIKSLVNRGVGKSTACALHALASAINNPGTPVVCSDPDAGHKDRHVRAAINRSLRKLTEDLVALLNLQDIVLTAHPDGYFTVQSNYCEEL